MSTIRVPTTTAGSRHHAAIRVTLATIHVQRRRSMKYGRSAKGTIFIATAIDQHDGDVPTRPAHLSANFFSLAPGPHGHPNAAAALGTPPCRRELSLMPSGGPLGIAAGAAPPSRSVCFSSAAPPACESAAETQS